MKVAWSVTCNTFPRSSRIWTVSGSLRYAGTGPVNVIGDGDRPWWDAILVVEYPTPQAFLDMVSDPGYQVVHEHRAAALEQGDLVATSEWAIGS